MQAPSSWNLNPLTGWFVLSVRQVVRLRVVEKKAELFRFSDWALLFLFAKFFLAKVGPRAKLVCLFDVGRRHPPWGERKNLSKFFFFKVRERARLVWLSRVWGRFRFKGEVPSQSALVHKLMYSGFFICQNFVRQGRVVEYLPSSGLLQKPTNLSKKILAANSTQCSQAVTHPSTD